MPDSTIRAARPSDDVDAIWDILRPVFRRGATYAVDADITRDAALAYWFDHREVRVAVTGDRVVGTYYLHRNHAGNGGHVANCGYAVHPDARGAGIGRAMCADSLDRARGAGFTAMQFNLVVSTNSGAIRLWEVMGFDIVGTIPDGFRHPDHGPVDAFVMHRRL